jgi:8-oxo-dGTP diphosphatase
MPPMADPYCYPYPAHYVTTDVAVFTYRDGRLHLLLVQRGQEPYRGRWALPGGFLRPGEELEACARRELAEETALHTFFLEPFTTVGTVGRDPRGRVITVAYLGMVRWSADVRGGTDAQDARWHAVDELPTLAFDHADLVRAARARMERMLAERPMLFLQFLPEEFTVEQMQAVHDAVLAPTPGRRKFYRRAGDFDARKLVEGRIGPDRDSRQRPKTRD